MPQLKSDVELLHDNHWEGSILALLVAYAMEHGQLLQYLQVRGIPQPVLMALLTVVLQRVWAYARMGRQIAEMRVKLRVADLRHQLDTQMSQEPKMPDTLDERPAV